MAWSLARDDAVGAVSVEPLATVGALVAFVVMLFAAVLSLGLVVGLRGTPGVATLGLAGFVVGVLLLLEAALTKADGSAGRLPRVPVDGRTVANFLSSVES